MEIMIYFDHRLKTQKNCPRAGRAKRHAQQDILNMSALECIMLSMARCEVCKRGQMTRKSVNMKTLKNIDKVYIN